MSGTRCEALLELEYPSISVFSSTAFPVLTQVIPTETKCVSYLVLAEEGADFWRTVILSLDGTLNDLLRPSSSYK